MITELTKQQEHQISRWISKHIKLAQKPTNRIKAKKAVCNFYDNMDEKKPVVIFAQSPLSAVLMVVICKILFKQLKLVEDSQLYSQLGSQLYNQLDSQLYSQLRNQLYSQLRSQLHNQLRSQLHSQLRNQLYNQLYSQLDSQLHNINNDWYLVVWWLVWVGWYSYGKYIGIKFDKKIYDLFVNFVKNIHFIIPYKNIAFVSETPTRISWENGKLHNNQTMAVEYADGYGMYCLNGVRFEKELWDKIVNKKITAKEILRLKNMEQRYIALLNYKSPKLIKELNGKLLDSSKRGNKLYEIKIEKDKYKLLNYKCPSTNREYIKFVPEKFNKADEAQAWSFELEEKTYAELVIES